MNRVSRVCLLLLAAVSSSAAFGADEAQPATSEWKSPRVRLIRSWPEPVTVNGKTALGKVEILFDYDRGVAIEQLLAADGTVVQTNVRRKGEGAPRPTTQEIQEAMDFVRADPEFARIIEHADAQLQGGFILNEPAGKPCGPGTRCLQIKLNTSDGMGFIRWAVVDLTKNVFAYRSYMPSTGEGR
jgi:hypothetical protein